MSTTWEQQKERVETLRFSADSAINKKVKSAIEGIKRPGDQKLFLNFPTDREKELVADFFIDCCIKQENAPPSTRRIYLIALARLYDPVRGLQNIKKSLDDITAKELTEYLNKIQRKREEDPDQSWISTYKTFAFPLQKFYKWRKYPDLTPRERRRLPKNQQPDVLKGLVIHNKTGSKSPIKAKDIWNDEDTALFLKYCKENRRLRFYHALAIETSGRPGELLQLKIGDINIETEDSDENKMYAVLDIGRYGKKGRSRIVGITEFTLQYYQDYLPSTHPDPNNKDAFVFMSKEASAKYLQKSLPISIETLRSDYRAFRHKVIPKLLKSPEVPEADKKHLQLLRDQKRWNPYNMRHSSITKLARHPSINDFNLRQHAGWSKTSNMVEVYTHELKGDSLEHVMMAYGVNIKQKRDKTAAQLRQEMVGPHCPFCHKVNIPGSLLCVSCQRPVSVISYDSMTKELDGVKKQFEELKKDQEQIYQTLQAMQIMKGVDEEQKKLLVQSDIFRQSFVSAQQELEQQQEEEGDKLIEEKMYSPDNGNSNKEKKKEKGKVS